MPPICSGARRASWSSRPCKPNGRFLLRQGFGGTRRRLLYSFRTPQHKGHPHPVLSRSTRGILALITAGSPPTELEARLHLALTVLQRPNRLGVKPDAAAGKGKSPVFHRKTRGVKTGASSSAAMANAVTAEFTPSIDIKKRRFLGLFCRKTGVRPKLFNTLLCVFTCFWDSRLFQTLALQGEPARGSLQNKSCLKTYRRFFVRSGMCLNKSRESRNDWPG